VPPGKKAVTNPTYSELDRHLVPSRHAIGFSRSRKLPAMEGLSSASSAPARCRGEEGYATDLVPLAAGSFAGLITAQHERESRYARSQVACAERRHPVCVRVLVKQRGRWVEALVRYRPRAIGPQ
jgi:hypothetical protein